MPLIKQGASAVLDPSSWLYNVLRSLTWFKKISREVKEKDRLRTKYVFYTYFAPVDSCTRTKAVFFRTKPVKSRTKIRIKYVFSLFFEHFLFGSFCTGSGRFLLEYLAYEDHQNFQFQAHQAFVQEKRPPLLAPSFHCWWPIP